MFAPHLYQKERRAATASSDTNTVRSGARDLAPFLKLRPDLRKRAEFRSSADENVNPLFQRIRIVCRGAHVLDVLKKLRETVRAIIKNDHAISRISARTP